MINTLLEKKEIIHIASEIVVIVGIVYYFNQKNKKLMNHIEDLVQRIEDQEDMLQKHEQIIKSLADNLNRISNSQHTNDQQSVAYQRPPAPKNKIKQSPKNQPKTHTKPPLSAPPKQEKSKVHVTFQKPAPQPVIEEEYSDGEEIESNSDLDMELAEELGELVSDDDNEDLKKDR